MSTSDSPVKPLTHLLIASLLISLLLCISGCASTPDLTTYRLANTQGNSASIWADNQQNSFAMIVDVDGKGTPSRGWNGYPYSVTVEPGSHKVGVLISASPQFARFNLDADLTAGHTYALRYTSLDYNHVVARLDDLGLGVQCSYSVVGKLHGGYKQVQLNCN